MKAIGKKNMVFGFCYMIITIGLGMFLANKLGSGDSEWIQSSTRMYLKTAHVHGNLESVLNILIGFILCRYGSGVATLARVASILAIVGAVFHSGMLFLGGLGVDFAMKLAPVGAISLLVTIVLMAVVSFKGVND